MRYAAALALLFAGRAALAHDADMIYAQLERVDGAGVRERLTMTPRTLLWLAPVDEDGNGFPDARELEAGAAAIASGVWDQIPLRAEEGPCVRRRSAAQLRENYVELTAELKCGRGELTQTFRILSVLPSGYRVVLGAFGQGELRGQSFARGNEQTLTVLGAARTEPVRGLLGWVGLGVQHIFTGVDHLAFLVAVLLVGGSWKRTLGLVTSFTVAHSITLGLAALGWVALTPPVRRWVEVAIAASIVWVALENLILRQHRHRAFLTFGFGLVHGLGFASALISYGLGSSAVAGIFGFNVGVELGQAAVVIGVHPLVRLLERQGSINAWAVRVGSGAVLAAGAFWMVERALG
ncbi:MAG TPA: HupE/UreJ family protein [Myxococcaceae bacterium]|nr:HupE/UreJ family protein [Myxococcaceae bacterium]